MTWKIIRNSEPTIRTDTFSGNCPRFNTAATIAIHSVGSIVCKTDLQKIYHKAGLKCSLLVGTNEASFSSCMKNCPLVPEKF